MIFGDRQMVEGFLRTRVELPAAELETGDGAAELQPLFAADAIGGPPPALNEVDATAQATAVAGASDSAVIRPGQEVLGVASGAAAVIKAASAGELQVRPSTPPPPPEDAPTSPSPYVSVP